VYGDSLSAAYGMAQSRGWVALLGERVKRERPDYSVANASVSGETSAGGVARIEATLARFHPTIVIVELGANDGLRGLAVDEMKKNLGAIIERAKAKRVAVLLAGMEAPPNFGPDYTVSFRQAYRDLARQYKVTLLPFLLDKVAGNAPLNQADGIHPNVEGERIVADTVWTVLQPMVKQTAE
jgi:acyl-CoA thioesterase-1